MARITYAIVLEISLDGLAPGFWEGISKFEFCQGLDRENFRFRQEIARLENENVTEENRARGLQVIERLAHQLALPRLRQILGRPELDAAEASKIAHIYVQPCENIPNPKSAHGMGPENSAVHCPDCNEPMITRKGPHGPFWGCRNYPACKGRRAISK